MSSSKSLPFSDAELLALNTWTNLEEFGKQRSEPVDASQATRTLTVEEIEAMQQQAYDEAFAQGLKDGYAEGKAEGYIDGELIGLEAGRKQGYAENLHLVQKQAAELVLLMETLSEPFQHLDEEVETELVRLTVTIASQIIRREIKTDPGQIIAVIREAIKVLPLSNQTLTLNLHPEDAELVKSVFSIEDSMPQWRLVENPLLSRGGCVVDTETSHIDASLENRVAAVVANVLGGERMQDDAL